MRLEALFAALVLFGDLAGPAQADLRGQPQFSAAESQTIARNELLTAVVAADPWLVCVSACKFDPLSGGIGVQN